METFWVVYKRLLGLARVLLAVVLLMVTTTVVTDCPVEARSSKKSSSKKRSTSKKRTSKKRSSRSSRKRSKRSRKSSHRSRSRKASKPRAPKYAYPYDFFMMDAPAFDRTPISQDKSSEIMRQFVRGQAGHHPAATMVQAGIFKYHALKGGIFHRREPIKYIIMHSTETGNPNMDAPRIINSWSSRGRRHPGAQFVIDRQGNIYQAVDPDLGTVHINIFKTIPGVNNDNCIGIEMVHSGRQDYPASLVTSAVRLVNYLQERYNIPDENVTTHRYVQQGDHTDPVNFDWNGFIMQKNSLRNEAIAMKLDSLKRNSRDWTTVAKPIPGAKPEVKRSVEGAVIESRKDSVPKESLPPAEPENKNDPDNLLDLKRSGQTIYKEYEEPKPPATLLQLRGPIKLEPEDAARLRPESSP